MSFLKGFEVASSGLTAQRTRMNITASNLANAETTETEDGGPYIRKKPSFETDPQTDYQGTFSEAVQGVDVKKISEDTKNATKTVYEPSHPDANGEGYVEKPNINVTEEMTEMISSSRSYEANATAFKTLKSMAQQALQIG